MLVGIEEQELEKQQPKSWIEGSDQRTAEVQWEDQTRSEGLVGGERARVLQEWRMELVEFNQWNNGISFEGFGS